eukprot:Phypoly_transcript_20136.p1 GENE.Phypoly_transcript_20136~~Phypoly_transcript_20136.p1  ORF type:complete len:154 (+),score=25.31 Phypoly_transcript_20136:44-505(+)
MGEPLMYKHFPEIIEICKANHVKMNLTTNGTFIGRGVHEWGNMILPVASDIKISWNGASREIAEKVMIGSRFDKQLANLKEFLKIRDHIAATQGNRATGICFSFFLVFFCSMFCCGFPFFLCEFGNFPQISRENPKFHVKIHQISRENPPDFA